MVGIIDFGVDLIHAYLSARAESRVIILGTPATIEADTHRTRLVERGIDAERIICQPCDRLAGEIEKDPEGATVRAMVESYIRQAADVSRTGAGPLRPPCAVRITGTVNASSRPPCGPSSRARSRFSTPTRQ